MKTSFVSTSAISQAQRYQMMRLQADLVKAQTESTTGMVADKGLALGNRTGQTITFQRDIERLETIRDANAIASARLTATQNGLNLVSGAAQAFLSTLTSTPSGDTGAQIAAADARAAFATLHGVVNTSLNGEYIFAGINTDAAPLADFADPLSPGRQAFDTAFQSHFDFPVGDPQAAGIDKQAMQAFLDGPARDLFLGAGWGGVMSDAADQPITSRITTSETASTSVSANEIGLRRLVMASAVVMALQNSGIGQEAREAVAGTAASLVGTAVADIAGVQAEVGITQNRITRANERMTMQVSLFKTSLQGMQAVDPYEAATRVTNLLTQIETSYALTARMNQLSLLRYLT
jgi:flagellar hook-associated protein 3 FlgL